MKAQILKVYIKKNNKDISEKIERLRYERCITRENLLTLTVAMESAQELSDDEDLVEGTMLKFQYGFAGRTLSEIYEAKITDIDVCYADRVSVVIKALGTGVALNKGDSQKIWKNKTASGIAKELADKYKLKFEIQLTQKVYETMPQGNRTDAEFLKYLASLEKGGLFQFYTDNSTLIFRPRDKSKGAKLLFTYGVNIIRFKPSLKDLQQSAAATETEAQGVDPMTKEPYSVSSLPSDIKDVAMGKKDLGTVVRDVNGVIVGTIKKQIQVPSDKEEAQAKTDAETRKASSGLKATLEIQGNPILNLEDIITVAGVARRYSGNWYIEKITSDVGNSYTESLDLSKDGTDTPAKEGAKDKDNVNSTVGEDSGEGKKVKIIKKRDNDGNRIR